MIKVLTPSGWSDFNGIKRKEVNESFLIGNDKNSQMQCSVDHQFKIGGEFTTADVVNFPIFEKIEGEPIDVFDLVDVDDGNEYYTDSFISHNCHFMGSGGTLISGKKLSSLVFEDPINGEDQKDLKLYALPIDGHQYVFSVDVAEGVGGDYSVINIIDITLKPFKQVGVYRNNHISPYVLAELVYKLTKTFFDPIVIVESNSIGAIVADELYNVYEYENLISSETKNHNDELVAYSHAPGIRQTKKTKSIGCASLKALVESDALQITDFQTIQELSTFVKVRQSYEADVGGTDDIAMTLVLFAWVVSQEYFSNYTPTSLKAELQAKYIASQENEHLAFGFVNNGIDSEDLINPMDLFRKG